MGDLNLNFENTDHAGEEAANKRLVSRSCDPSQPIRGLDEEEDSDPRMRELDGVIVLGNIQICTFFFRTGFKSIQCWTELPSEQNTLKV